MSIIVSMSLDFAECDRARLARDPVYDGRFYTGVHTTGIYCRPVCPVRPARSANVSFFPSAAAAEAAGFRPCLRCRPETAPFCSAWIGSRATVERALRLIVDDGALDGEGANVERLAVPASKSCEGGQDCTGAAGQTAHRRDEPADDRDRDAGGLWQSTPVQLRLCRSLRQTAD
jgi:hypothetical protein